MLLAAPLFEFKSNLLELVPSRLLFLLFLLIFLSPKPSISGIRNRSFFSEFSRCELKLWWALLVLIGPRIALKEVPNFCTWFNSNYSPSMEPLSSDKSFKSKFGLGDFFRFYFLLSGEVIFFFIVGIDISPGEFSSWELSWLSSWYWDLLSFTWLSSSSGLYLGSRDLRLSSVLKLFSFLFGLCEDGGKSGIPSFGIFAWLIPLAFYRFADLSETL